MVFDKKLGRTFKKVGESYHIGRREYPKQLIQDIIKISKMNKDSLVLDVGCGTGLSTIPFAKTKSKIIGIDISKNMLDIAKKLSVKHKNISYEQISFEKFNSPSSSFDLMLFGTSMHWLDSKLVYGKTNKLLKKTGYMALFWEPIRSLCKAVRLMGMEEIFVSNCPNYPKIPASINMPKIRKKDIEQSKLFAKPILKKYKFIQKCTLEEFFALIGSYSWIISLSKKKKAKLIREVTDYLGKNAKVNFPTEMYLIMARRK
jgi:SAM-dependent methyltransferase